MPAEALHASVCLRHELEGLTALLQPPAPAMQGRGPSTGDSGRAGWPPVLACRSCLAPSDLFLPLLVLRLAAGLQDLLLLPWGEGVTETYPLGSVLQWLKKRKKKTNAAKQSQQPLLQLHRAMGVDGRGPALDSPLSWDWWPGKPRQRHLVPSLPPQSPPHPPCFLTTFEQFL